MKYINVVAFITCTAAALYEFNRGNKAIATINAVFAVANGLVVAFL